MFYQNDIESVHAIEKRIQWFKMGIVLEAVNTIKILIELKENEEVLALYGGDRYVLSQEYRNWYAPNWHSWRERHINNFRAAAPTLEQTFVKPVNAGRTPGHQLRMRQQSEPSVIFDRIMSAPTTSPTLVAPVANLSLPHLF